MILNEMEGRGANIQFEPAILNRRLSLPFMGICVHQASVLVKSLAHLFAP